MRLVIVSALAVICASCASDTPTAVKNTADEVTTATSAATTSIVSTTAAPPPTTTPPARVGATIVLKGNRDYVGGQTEGSLIAVTLLKLVDPAPPAEYSRPPDGHRFASAQVRLENRGRAVYDDSPSNCGKVIDADGQQFGTTVSDSGAGPGFGGSVRLAPGDNRVGYITFAVPQAAVLRRFTFTLDSGFGPETGDWLL